jgi:hypothetical protein
MLAKDCMESSKGAAGFRMKNEMASRGGVFALAPARKASHQTGSDWWWVIKLRAWGSVGAGLRICVNQTCRVWPRGRNEMSYRNSGRKANLTGG